MRRKKYCGIKAVGLPEEDWGLNYMWDRPTCKRVKIRSGSSH